VSPRGFIGSPAFASRVALRRAKTGAEIHGVQRLQPGAYSGSPVLADGKISVTDEEELTSVFRAGSKFEILAGSALNDYFLPTTGRLGCFGTPRVQ
jgi:hypothetical protein